MLLLAIFDSIKKVSVRFYPLVFSDIVFHFLELFLIRVERKSVQTKIQKTKEVENIPIQYLKVFKVP